MPNIVEYNAPEGELRPNPAGEQAFQLEGRRAGSLGSERAQLIRQAGMDTASGLRKAGAELDTLGAVAERHQASQEISNGALGLAETVDQLDQHYNQAVNQSPDDPNVSANWRRDVMGPALANFQDQFNTPEGQKWAAAHVAQIATEMYRHTTAADMNRAADQAELAQTQTVNTLTNMVQRNPAMIDTALGMLPGTYGALAENANLSPEVAEKMRTTLAQHSAREIVAAGLKGAIENNPEEGLRLAQSGKYDKYISGADQSALESYARTMVRVRDIGVKGAAKADEVKLQQVSDARASDVFGQLSAGNVQPDTAMKIATDPQLQQPEKQALLNHIAPEETPTTSDPVTMDKMLGYTAGPGLSSADILNAKGLAPADRQWLMQLAQQPPEQRQAVASGLMRTLDAAKPAILGPAMARTSAGMAAYNRFQQATIAAARAGEPIDLTKNPDLVQQFQPQPQELVPPPAGPPKRNLNQIFGGRSDRCSRNARPGVASAQANRRLTRSPALLSEMTRPVRSASSETRISSTAAQQ